MTIKHTAPASPADLANVFIAIQEAVGVEAVTAAAILRRVAYPNASRRANRLRTLLRSATGVAETEATRWIPCTAKQLGQWLRRHLGLIAAGLTVERVRKHGQSKSMIWRIATPEQHAAFQAASGIPAPKPKPRVRRPKIVTIPKPEAFRPFIQRVIRATPHGAVRLASAQMLRDQLGAGHVVEHGNRYHVHLPVRDPSTVDRVVRQLSTAHPTVSFEVTDTRGSTAAVPHVLVQPEVHRVPYLDPDGRSELHAPRRNWCPLDPF